jgi:hypothetical protein
MFTFLAIMVATIVAMLVYVEYSLRGEDDE